MNVYRCRFGVDVELVPGGCPDPDPVPTPDPTAGPDPTATVEPTVDPTPEPVYLDCGIGCEWIEGSTPRATRLLTDEEIIEVTRAAGWENDPYVLPQGVPEAQALGWITECLFNPGAISVINDAGYADNPAVVCNKYYRYMSHPLNWLGYLADRQCVWDLYMKKIDPWQVTTNERGNSAAGFAVHCKSSLDPDPDRPMHLRCWDLFERVNPEGAEAERWIGPSALCYRIPPTVVDGTRCTQIRWLANRIAWDMRYENWTTKVPDLEEPRVYSQGSPLGAC